MWKGNPMCVASFQYLNDIFQPTSGAADAAERKGSYYDLTVLCKHVLTLQSGYIPDPGVKASLWSGRKTRKIFT